MNENMLKLECWNDSISMFPRLDIWSAKKLFLEIKNESNIEIKNRKREKLINETLYFIYEFLKNNSFLLLNSDSYDMDDIISSFIEVWINRIDEGKLLEVSMFFRMFDRKFFSELLESLSIKKHRIFNVSNVSLQVFYNLFLAFVDIKNNNDHCDYDDFLNYLNNNDCNISKTDILGINLYDVYYLLEKIYESCGIKPNEKIKLSKNKVIKLIYLLIYNGIELRDKLEGENYFSLDNDLLLDDIYIDKIMNYIFCSGVINDSEAEILLRRYGFYNDKCEPLRSVGKILGISAERVRQKEDSAMEKLKRSAYLKKLVKY